MNQLIKKYVYVNYFVQGLTIAINFLYSLIIVRQLGAGSYGEYAVFYNSLVFAVLLLGFNFPSIIAFFIANQKADPSRLLYTACLAILFTTGIVVAALSLSDTLGFSEHVFPGAENKPLWIFFFSAAYLLLQANQLTAAYLNAHKIFIPVSVFSLIANSALLLFWGLLTFGSFSIAGSTFDLIWWVTIAVNLLILFYSIHLILARTPVPKFSKLLETKELRLMARFALIVYLCNTLQFLNYKMDIWFVHYYLGEGPTGIYALALSLSQLIWVFPNAISGVLLHYFKVDQREYSVQMAVHYARITIYFSLLTALLLSLVYYFALPSFYGPQFHETFRVCLVLFLGTIPFSLSILLANLNSGIGFIKFNLYGTLFTFLLGLVLDIILIPFYGMMGAAIAKVVIYVIGLGFQLIVGGVLYKLRWFSLFRFPSFSRSKEIKS